MGQAFIGAEQAIEQIAAGRMVVVVDDADRENEGDVVVAAEFADPTVINFMVRHARGLVCLALDEERCAELDLPLIPRTTGAAFDTAFTVSIEARSGVTTGISAHDRAHTIRVAIDPSSSAEDLVRPVTSSPCARGRGACSSGPDTPRPRSTSPAWRGCGPRA